MHRFFSGNETNLHLCIVKSTTFEADCTFMLKAGVVSVRAFFICNVPNVQVTGAVRHLFFSPFCATDEKSGDS